tara:strand:+ start:1886 stop:2530 length:645 start_codon:yes stop_codon:yes gene_type:complete
MLSTMSRENKIALIIGFGLVLLVGVLISDHLSQANRQVTADLSMAIDPLVDEDDRTTLVEFASLEDPTTPLDLSHATVAPDDRRLHVVREGETLHAISRRWYGDESAAIMLANYNNLPDPGQLVTGTRLLIPESTTTSIVLETPLAAPSTTAVAAADELNVYTVQPGDTLSQIAQKLLGSSRRTPQLFELNRDVIGNIDSLQVGTELRYHRPSS